MIVQTTTKESYLIYQDPQNKRYFSPDLANKSIPYIRPIFAEMISLYERIKTLQSRAQNANTPQIKQATIECESNRFSHFSNLVEQLTLTGAILRMSFQTSQVLFPALRKDREEIYFPWELGQDQVTHYFIKNQKKLRRIQGLEVALS